jgi:hypothetical protein
MLHVFIGEILANMTQVSDVAPGPLVSDVLRLRVGRFWTTKEMKIFTKCIFSWNFFFIVLWMQRFCNALNYSSNLFIFIPFVEAFLRLIKLMKNSSKSNLCCVMPIQHAKTPLFLKRVCFFPWLAIRFHDFELMQNRSREKNRNGQMPNYKVYMYFGRNYGIFSPLPFIATNWH